MSQAHLTHHAEEPIPLIVSGTDTFHEVAGRVSTAIRNKYGEAVFASELALFERLIDGKLERALEVLLCGAANSVQFQYALCWLDASELSPVLKLCWSQTRFRDLLSLKYERMYSNERRS